MPAGCSQRACLWMDGAPVRSSSRTHAGGLFSIAPAAHATPPLARRWTTPSGSAWRPQTWRPRAPPRALRCPSAGWCRRCTAPWPTSLRRTRSEACLEGGEGERAAPHRLARQARLQTIRAQQPPSHLSLSLTPQHPTRLPRFDFGEAGRLLYDFVWSDFADWCVLQSMIGEQRLTCAGGRERGAGVVAARSPLQLPSMTQAPHTDLNTQPHPTDRRLYPAHPPAAGTLSRPRRGCTAPTRRRRRRRARCWCTCTTRF